MTQEAVLEEAPDVGEVSTMKRNGQLTVGELVGAKLHLQDDVPIGFVLGRFYDVSLHAREGRCRASGFTIV